MMLSIYKYGSSTTEAALEVVFFKKSVVKNFAKFLLNKVPGLHVTLLKRRLRHRCFSVNFAKFLRTLFFYRTPPGDCFCSKHSLSKKVFLKISQYLQENTCAGVTFLRSAWVKFLRITFSQNTSQQSLLEHFEIFNVLKIWSKYNG